MPEATIAIVDFGGQYVQLIARRVREHLVHSIVVAPDVTVNELRAHDVVGLIFSGGPASVYGDDAPRCLPEVLELDVPILGICYGMQLACEMMGQIIIDRSDTQAALESINSARGRIKNGLSIIFFAEGTRSRKGEVEQFKKGAFRLAQELSVPILPVSIHDTNKVLPSNSMDWHPGHVKLKFHDPIPTVGLTSEDVSALGEQTRQVIGEAVRSD